MKKLLYILFFLLPLCGFAQLSTDFETGDLNAWIQVPESRWASSAVNSLAGNYSLKHVFDNPAAATDIIYIPLSGVPVNSGITQWRFLLRHGYNPSGTNKWAVMLFSNAAGSEWKSGGVYEGYAVGVNMLTTNDTLTLYAVKNNTFSAIRKTSVNWELDIKATGTGAVEIIRDAYGEWQINAALSGSFAALQAVAQPAVHNTYGVANYFGITYSYTASADMLLWVDDVSVSFTRVDIPTKIASAVLQNHSHIRLSFTQSIEPVSAATAANYKLCYAADTLYPSVVEVINDKQVLLKFANPLPRGDAVIKVSDITDENNALANDSKAMTVFYLLRNDVVLNEIMAKADPSNGLPEVGYIELYNRLNVPVSLSGWKVEYITTSTGSTTIGNIGAASIPPMGYMILCSSTAVDAMRNYGNATSLSYISSLTKNGKTLMLKSNDGLLISHVTYSDKWNTDANKQAGGWSLEKIDADNLSETTMNWAVSVNVNGGTPGSENSVKAANPDREAPALIDFRMLDNHCLRLIFNEPFDTLQAKKASSYTIGHNIGNPQQVLLSSTIPEQVELQFAEAFNEGVVYELNITAPLCDLAGNAPDIKKYFGNMPPPNEHDIVVNEVLFHPYSGGADFVEIYNRSDKVFDLRTVKIAHRDKNTTIASVQTIAQTYYLKPNDYAVLTTSLQALQMFYAVRYPEKVILLSSLPAFPNESGCVVLLSTDDKVLDEFIYTEKMHSGFINNPAGISLERVNPERPSNERSNWQSAAQDADFATPTYRNSQYNNQTSGSGNFSFPYEVFSPDGDGYNDVLYIDYQLPSLGYVASITIYDTQGRLARELEKNTLLGASGRFAWDGTRHDNRRAALGMYVVLIECYDLTGNVQHIKKTCALATR